VTTHPADLGVGLVSVDRMLFQMYRLAQDGAEALVSEIAHVRRSS
jgi:hypothetical protein